MTHPQINVVSETARSHAVSDTKEEVAQAGFGPLRGPKTAYTIGELGYDGHVVPTCAAPQ